MTVLGRGSGCCATVAEGLEVLVEAAEVVGIEPVGTQGQRFISLQTGEADASVVVQAAAAGEVRRAQVRRLLDRESLRRRDVVGGLRRAQHRMRIRQS